MFMYIYIYNVQTTTMLLRYIIVLVLTLDACLLFAQRPDVVELTFMFACSSPSFVHVSWIKVFKPFHFSE